MINLNYIDSSTTNFSKSSVGLIDTTSNQMFSPSSSNTGIGTFPTIIIQPMWIVGERQKEKITFRFDWAGGLSELKGKINSVDLAHEALKWR
jgi:hypothetical protein